MFNLEFLLNIVFERCQCVCYACFGRALGTFAGEESVTVAEEATNLLERGRQSFCRECEFSVRDDARVRVALHLFVCVCVCVSRT